MHTVITDSAIEAAGYIKRGGIVAFPTETVYGLGAAIFNGEAIGKIFKAKQRPSDNPLIAHVSEIGQIFSLVEEVTPSARLFMDSFFPGPLTVVLKKGSAVPEIATAGLDTIGVRMPVNGVAQEFLRACGVSVAAPSANFSGRPSPTTWEAVNEDLDGRIDCILRGDPCQIGLESTVVDCTGDFPLVLRSGSVSIEQLKELVSKTQIYKLIENEPARSPGMKHRHYSPRAKVVLMNAGSQISKVSDRASRIAFIGITSQQLTYMQKRMCKDVSEYAYVVFEFFRECDRGGIEVIYCESVEESGIGLALMDRLWRASEG